MRIAVLADIHGNLPALAAVIAELERLQPDQVVLDGDLINGAPFNSAVIDLVRRQDWAVVRGNHEFYYLDFGTARATPGCEDPHRWGQLHWLVEQIQPEQGRYLGMLPDERILYLPGTQPICVAHGVPGQNRLGFHSETPAAEVAAALVGIAAQTVISAHTHVQVDRLIERALGSAGMSAEPTADGEPAQWHLVNPGSVGMPINGDARAQFALLEAVPAHSVPGGWRATFYRVPYDRRPTLAAFAETGMSLAGGVMSKLFYWQLVTALPELIYFFRWAYKQGLDPDCALADVFQQYLLATQRDQQVHSDDPLFHPYRS
jgi:predicted phosphodiesterase